MSTEGSANPRRLLVLTSATGAGHDTHAHATAAWCARLFGPAVEVTVAHALEDSHAFYRGGVAFYNLIQRRAPWFHHIYYNVIEGLDALNFGTVGLGREAYVTLLKQARPHAILSVHDCLNRGYFELARETLGSAVKCATYCVEFGGGYGFSRNWVNPRADFFFGRTLEVVRAAVRRGMPPERTRVAGHWAPPPFYEAPKDPAPKTEAGAFTLLLGTGGAGAQNHRAVLRALAPLGERLRVVALCGRDEPARRDLEAWAKRSSPLAVEFLPFTDRMPDLLRGASAVFARAGATTAGEALLCGCPPILNALGLPMPQELPTARWLRARGLGPLAFTPAAIRAQLLRWRHDPAEFDHIRERMRRACDETTPEMALRLLLDC